jgi:fatty acid desaturase
MQSPIVVPASEAGLVSVPEFVEQLRALGDRVRSESSEADVRHLKKIEWWGRLCTLVGYASAWIVPNPVSAFLMSQGNLTRWLLMHHIGHGGYDGVPGIPERYTTRRFAVGMRRWLDWPDWMVPAAWNYEHNRLHHYHLNEAGDPDLVQRNVAWLRQARLARPLKLVLVAFAMVSWKWFYYAPSTLRELESRARQVGAKAEGGRTPLGLSPESEQKTGAAYALRHFISLVRPSLWLRCYLPYMAYRFGLLPLLFLPLGWWAWFSVLMNSLLAEVITNVHTFIVIVPNHAGDDMPVFNERPESFDENLVRQVVGSVNYRTGGDGNDFLHMWLNYQIEHHVWPRMTMLGYQRVQAELKTLCDRHQVPYVQHSVWYRLWQTVRVMMGEGTHRVWQGSLMTERGSDLAELVLPLQGATQTAAS